MQLLPDDERFLHRALALARDAAAFASPNPTVGCVLVRDGDVFGEGAHFYERYDHAEIAALKDARAKGHSAVGATAYVTLEPCAHHGRTGPCAEALTSAGISRCVVATLDPNPQVSGRGLHILRRAGVETLLAEPTSEAAQGARHLNDAFAFSVQHGRPFITLKAAVSLDGYLAPPPQARSALEPFWLTGEAARADVQILRHRSDAILTGINTVLADDPMLTDRSSLPRRRALLRIILDSQLRLTADSTIIQSAAGDVLVFAVASAPQNSAKHLQGKGVEVVTVAESHGRVDLHAVLQVLHERGIRSVLLEAGSAINGAFLSQDLVDEAVLYFSETELGEGSIPFAAHVTSPNALQQLLSRTNRVSFQHSTISAREDVRVSGYLHDPWLGVR